VESAAPRVRRALRRRGWPDPARAGPGRPGARAGSQPSRRDSPDEPGTGGQPGAGFPISGSRFDWLWGRWSVGASGALRRVMLRAAPVQVRQRTAGRGVGGELHLARQRPGTHHGFFSAHRPPRGISIAVQQSNSRYREALSRGEHWPGPRSDQAGSAAGADRERQDPPSRSGRERARGPHPTRSPAPWSRSDHELARA
jgi:hypothetical protein